MVDRPDTLLTPHGGWIGDGGWTRHVSNLFASSPLTFTLHLRNAGGGAFQQPITAWVLGGLELA